MKLWRKQVDELSYPILKLYEWDFVYYHNIMLTFKKILLLLFLHSQIKNPNTLMYNFFLHNTGMQ